jgi:hypothetical protein
MAHWKKAFPSKYLQASDLDHPVIATIKSVPTENVGSGDNLEEKLVAKFQEDVKGVVLNLTRAEAISAIAGDDDTDTWVGVRIRLSRGMTRYQGKKVPCIVIDAPPKTSRKEVSPSVAPDDRELDDDIDAAFPREAV